MFLIQMTSPYSQEKGIRIIDHLNRDELFIV